MLAAISSWDAAVLLWVQAHLRTPLGDLLIPLWSSLGNSGLLWIALALLLLCFPKTRRAGALALAGMALNFLAVNVVIKHLAARPRPWLVVEGLEVLLFEPDPNSFPSGHTSAACAFAAALCCTLDRTWIKVLAVCAALSMGWSRIYVAVHFPTDVLCGALIGAACGLLAVRLYRGLFQRESLPRDSYDG